MDPIRDQVKELLERVAVLEANVLKGKKQEASSTEAPKKPERTGKDKTSE